MRYQLALLGLTLAFSPFASAQNQKHTPWVASWATSVESPEGNQAPIDPSKFSDVTLRQVVHLSVGGTAVRVVFSNAFGTQPLVLDAASVALAEAPGSSRILPSKGGALTFSGRPGVTIPIGAEYLSDPLPLTVPALSSLAISFHLPAGPAVMTTHSASHATSFLLPGNHGSDPDLPGAEKVVHWMQLAEVDMTGPQAMGTVVAFGDSITDGTGSTLDGNDRWPDDLAALLQGSSVMRGRGVVNEGIGGNHLLTNGTGQSALERFDRDVLAIAGVQTVVLLEGINDLGLLARQDGATAAEHDKLVEAMEASMTQIVERAHAHGLRVYGATILPDGDSPHYHPNAQDEAARQAVNRWIAQPGHFDAVVDLDGVVRDPAHPDRMLPLYDSGDHLHPSPAGYKVMGRAVAQALTGK